MVSQKMWKCDVCGYVHRGDAPPDTCPICGVDADAFSPLEVTATRAPKKTAAKSGWRCVICHYVDDGDAPPDRCPVCSADSDLFERDDAKEIGAATAPRKHVVIVGEGVAGITAAEQVLVHGGDHVKLTLVGNEAPWPYYRLNLTRLLAGQVTEAALTMKDEAWFAAHDIQRITDTVTSIDPRARRLTLKDGAVLDWDDLVLATGSHPFVPPISGANKAGVFTVRTLADVHAIHAQVTPETRVVIVGCGVLGLEAAGALTDKVSSVTVLESGPWAMMRQLNQTAAHHLVDFLQTRRIEVMTGVSAKEIEGGDRVTGVALTNGAHLDAELVIVSTGVRANTHLARQAGIETAQGIVVDDMMRTSAPHIYAAGDVAEHRGRMYGLWPAAFSQGFVAGTNAAGGEARFTAMAPFNQLKVLDVDVYSIGNIAPTDGSFRTFETGTAQQYCYLVMRDRRIVGAVLYGNTADAALISSAIEHKTSIDELDALLARLPGFADFVRD